MDKAITALVLLSALCFGAIHGIETVGGRVVTFQNIPQNWFTASEICQAQGMQLLTIHSRQELDEVLGLPSLQQFNIWLGATDAGHKGEFVWTMSGLRIGSAWWQTGQPDNANGREDCLELAFYIPSNQHLWNDANCIVQKPYFCEVPPAACSQRMGGQYY